MTDASWTIFKDADEVSAIRPCGITLERLATGSYSVRESYSGPYLVPYKLCADDLPAKLTGPAKLVLSDYSSFQKNIFKFKELGLVAKRGVLLHGTPGGGKTTLTRQIMNSVLKYDAVCLIGSPSNVMSCTEMVRSKEPNRPIVCVIEDVDDYSDDVSFLNFLDGSNQTSNIYFVCTTNYVNDLPPRFANRPGRFDLVLNVTLPDYNDRLEYAIPLLTKMGLQELAKKYAEDSNGFTMAHLKELFIGSAILGHPYEEVLGRLRNQIEEFGDNDEEDQNDDSSIDQPKTTEVNSVGTNG